jgi:negative regulator of flagellin synthesis FlgM
MNIDKIPPYSIDALQNSGTAAKTGTQDKDAAGSASSSDRLQLSKDYQDLTQAQKTIAGASDVRTDKVQNIKKQLDSGTYQIKPYDIAGKMLDEII